MISVGRDPLTTLEKPSFPETGFETRYQKGVHEIFTKHFLENGKVERLVLVLVSHHQAISTML